MPKTLILKPYMPLYTLNGKEIMAQKKISKPHKAYNVI